jgi:hypothetical protein
LEDIPHGSTADQVEETNPLAVALISNGNLLILIFYFFPLSFNIRFQGNDFQLSTNNIQLFSKMVKLLMVLKILPTALFSAAFTQLDSKIL